MRYTISLFVTLFLLCGSADAYWTTPESVYEDSGYYLSFTSNKSIDGVTSSFWLDGDQEQHHITYDLGVSVPLDAFSVYVGPYRHCCVDIYVSDDPDNFTNKVASNIQFDDKYAWNAVSLPVSSGRYIRLDGLTVTYGVCSGDCPASNTALRLYEVKASVNMSATTTSTSSTTTSSTTTSTTTSLNSWLDTFNDMNPRWDWQYTSGTGYHTLTTIDNYTVVESGITNMSNSLQYSDSSLHEVSHTHDKGVAEFRLRYDGDGMMGTMGWGYWYHQTGNLEDIDAAWFFNSHPDSGMPGLWAQVIDNGTEILTQPLDVNVSGWHTYRVDLQSDEILFSVDDELLASTQNVLTRNQKIEFWVDNYLIDENMTPIGYTPIDEDQRLYVDYVYFNESTTTTSSTTTSSTTTSTTTSSLPGFFNLLWKSNTTGTYDEFPSPIYDDGMVYIGSKLWPPMDGYTNVWGLNSSNGDKIWWVDLWDGAFPMRGTDGTGAVYGGTMCAGGNAGIFCVDKKTGNPICNVTDEPHLYHYNLVIADGKIFAAEDYSNSIHAFDVNTCQRLYSNQDAPAAYGGTPAASESCNMVCLGGNSADSGGDTLVCYTLDTLEKRWGANVKTWDSTPVIDETDCSVYQGGSYDTDGIYAFDSSGNLKWHCPTNSDVKAGPVLKDDVLYTVSNTDGVVIAYNITLPDSTSCFDREVWTAIQPGANSVYGTPAIAYGYLFVSDRGSPQIQVYDIDDGSYVASYDDMGPTYSSPAVANGVLYIAADDWYTYALNITSVDTSGETWLQRKGDAARTGVQRGVTTSTTTSTSTSTTTSTSTSTSTTTTVDPCYWGDMPCNSNFAVYDVNWSLQQVRCCPYSMVCA